MISLSFLFPAACRADYDPTAETQRLIDIATQNLEKDKSVLEGIETDIKTNTKTFGDFNHTEEALNAVLDKCRRLDVNNRMKLVLAADVNLVQSLFISKNQLADGVEEAVKDFLKDFAKDYVTDAATNYINERWPGIWSDGSTMQVGAAMDSSVQAVQKFNVALKMNYVAVDAYVRQENPDLAKKDGLLNGDLLILKHTEIILQKGKEAIQALEQLKSERLEKFKKLSTLKAVVQNDIARLQDDIRSWNRSIGLDSEIKKSNESSSAPPIVTFSANPSYDFGTAASNMHEAYQKLASGAYSCASYESALGNAWSGAQNKLNEILTPLYAAYTAAEMSCSQSNYSSCSAGDRLRAQIASVNNSFETQVRGTMIQLVQDAKSVADGPLLSFAQSMHQWGLNQVDFGDGNVANILGARGDGLGLYIWQYALSTSASNAIPQRFYAVGFRQMTQLDELLKGWLDDAKYLKDYFQQRLETARRAASQSAGLASTATQLAGKLQPNIELWSCFEDMGSDPNAPSSLIYWGLRYDYDLLSHFESGLAAISRDGEAAGRQLVDEAASKYDLTVKVVEVMRGAATVKAATDKLVAAAYEVVAAQQGDIDVSGERIYSLLGAYGISSTGLKSLEDRIKSLSDPAALEKEALSQILGAPGYSFQSQVLNKDGIEALKASVRNQLTAIDNARDRYATAYANTQNAETNLDTLLQGMRDKLAPIFPEEVPWFTKDAILEDNYQSDRLELSFRYESSAPGQLPDSGLGSDKLIERYATLAESYHALVDPEIPLAKVNRYAPAMEDLLKELMANLDRIQSMDPTAFMNESNRYFSNSHQIYQQASNAGTVDPKSRLFVAYVAIMGKMGEISYAYYQRQRLSQAEGSLQNLIDGINVFLGNSDAMGGWSSAQQWMDSIGYTKDAVDASVKNDPAVQALMRQLDNLMGKLKEVASHVDSATLQRDTQAIQAMYQDFTNAYQNKNLTALTHFLATNWQAADGSDINDLETTLSSTFRVFDSIVFKISGMSIQRVANSYQVSYQANLTGRINRIQKSHDEASSIVDTVAITPDGPVIMKTTGMLH